MIEEMYRDADASIQDLIVFEQKYENDVKHLLWPLQLPDLKQHLQEFSEQHVRSLLWKNGVS